MSTDFRIIEESKENIQPVRGGRRVTALQDALSHVATPKELEERQTEFERRVADTTTSDDPLADWIAYLDWLQEVFHHDPQNKILAVRVRCMNIFSTFKRYKNDIRFLRICIKYTDSCREPLEFFKQLDSNLIGTDHAMMYTNWSALHESSNQWKASLEVIDLGIARNAEPEETLKRYREALYKRMATADLTSSNPVTGDKENGLTGSRSALAPLRDGSATRTYTDGTKLSGLKRPRDENGGNAFEVFKDELEDGPRKKKKTSEGTNNPMAPLVVAQREKYKENTELPGRWNQARMPQSALAQSNANRNSASSKSQAFLVLDEELEQPSSTKQPHKLRNLEGDRAKSNEQMLHMLSYAINPQKPFAFRINTEKYSKGENKPYQGTRGLERAAYDRAAVYPGDGKEYSFEEIRARHWLATKSRRGLGLQLDASKIEPPSKPTQDEKPFAAFTEDKPPKKGLSVQPTPSTFAVYDDNAPPKKETSPLSFAIYDENAPPKKEPSPPSFAIYDESAPPKTEVSMQPAPSAFAIYDENAPPKKDPSPPSFAIYDEAQPTKKGLSVQQQPQPTQLQPQPQPTPVDSDFMDHDVYIENDEMTAAHTINTREALFKVLQCFNSDNERPGKDDTFSFSSIAVPLKPTQQPTNDFTVFEDAPEDKENVPPTDFARPEPLNLSGTLFQPVTTLPMDPQSDPQHTSALEADILSPLPKVPAPFVFAPFSDFPSPAKVQKKEDDASGTFTASNITSSLFDANMTGNFNLTQCLSSIMGVSAKSRAEVPEIPLVRLPSSGYPLDELRANMQALLYPVLKEQINVSVLSGAMPEMQVESLQLASDRYNVVSVESEWVVLEEAKRVNGVPVSVVMKLGTWWEVYMSRRLARVLSPQLRGAVFESDRGYLADGNAAALVQTDYFVPTRLSQLTCPLHDVLIMYYVSNMLAVLETLHRNQLVLGAMSLDSILLRDLTERKYDATTPECKDWYAKGVCFTDFSAALDGQGVSQSPLYGTADVPEHLRRKQVAFGYEVDLLRVCDVAHQLLNKSPIKVVENGGRWKSATAVKPYLATKQQWNELFDAFLNVSSEASAEETVALLHQKRVAFETMLAAQVSILQVYQKKVVL